MRRLLIFWLLMACTLPGVASAGQAYPFSLRAERSASGSDLIAHNRGPAPVSVRLALSAADNVRTTSPLPVFAVVRPYSEALLLQVRPAHPGRGLRFSTQSTFSVGNFHAIPDPRATYRLPFADGRSFVISQATGGPLTTHTAEDSDHAVDFTMPENTPVVAARGGVVIETEATNRFGGKDRGLLAMANYVRILHADETVATYAHLAPGGVRVRPGERVSAGTDHRAIGRHRLHIRPAPAFRRAKTGAQERPVRDGFSAIPLLRRRSAPCLHAEVRPTGDG